MALLNLIFNRRVPTQIGGITLDACLEQDHGFPCEPTENPVEEGADVTDHVRLRPIELQFEAVISDTPLDFNVIGSLVSGDFRGIARQFANMNRSVEQFNKLVELRNKRQPFDVVTGLKVYKNMVIRDLRIHRNATIGKAIAVSLFLQEIRIVKSSIGIDAGGADAVTSAGVKDVASKTKNLGQKIAKVLDPIRDARLLAGATQIFHLVRTLPLNA